jgi:hypothetical protein
VEELARLGAFACSGLLQGLFWGLGARQFGIRCPGNKGSLIYSWSPEEHAAIAAAMNAPQGCTASCGN